MPSRILITGFCSDVCTSIANFELDCEEDEEEEEETDEEEVDDDEEEEEVGAEIATGAVCSLPSSSSSASRGVAFVDTIKGTAKTLDVVDEGAEVDVAAAEGDEDDEEEGDELASSCAVLVLWLALS